jgi:hypothetical protein
MWRNMNETAGGRPIFGTPFVGLLGSEILAATGSGPNGPGAMFNDGLAVGSRYRMLLEDPGSFPGIVYEDGSIEATASVSTTYRLYEDNLLVELSPGVFDIPLDVVIGAAPSITSQPSNRTVSEGQSALFSVTASGAAPLSYQWRRNGTPIAGATLSSYSLSSPSAADSGAVFTVAVSNALGTLVSSPATLTVITLPSVGAAIPDVTPAPWDDIVYVPSKA